MFVKYAFDFLRCTFSLIFQLAATSHKGMWSSRSANITYTQCCGLLVFFSLQISCFPCHPTKCAIIYSFHVLLVVSKWGSSLGAVVNCICVAGNVSGSCKLSPNSDQDKREFRSLVLQFYALCLYFPRASCAIFIMAHFCAGCAWFHAVSLGFVSRV